MEKLFEALGLGTPFVYAAGTYALFRWLDGDLSEEKKTTFARFLHLGRYDSKII
jgi:hypothetical protein